MERQYYENAEFRTAIKKSKQNPEAMDLVNKHYKYLYSKLVKKKEDQDIFNDTVLSISYKYNPDKDFIEQFIFHFKSNQVGLVQENKMRNYLTIELSESYINIPDKEDEYLDKIDLNELVTDIAKSKSS